MQREQKAFGVLETKQVTNASLGVSKSEICVQALLLVSGSRLSFKLCRQKTGAMLEGSTPPINLRGKASKQDKIQNLHLDYFFFSARQ